jgi:hypothetical protein
MGAADPTIRALAEVDKSRRDRSAGPYVWAFARSGSSVAIDSLVIAVNLPIVQTEDLGAEPRHRWSDAIARGDVLVVSRVSDGDLHSARQAPMAAGVVSSLQLKCRRSPLVWDQTSSKGAT